MLGEQTKEYISRLSDADLLDYVLTGIRMYEPEALEFARKELESRKLPPEQMEQFRPAIVEKLARFDEQDPPSLQGSKQTPAILCQSCGLEAATRYVEYYENIGAIHVRYTQAYKGCFCRTCNHKFFWKSTTTTLFLGWWGIISFFMTISFLIGNIVTFIGSRSLPRVPEDAEQPQLDVGALAMLVAHAQTVVDRLEQGDDISDIARQVAPLADVTPGQAWLYIRELVAHRANTIRPAREPSRGSLVAPWAI